MPADSYKLTPEERLLLLLASAEPGSRADEQAAHLLSQPFDWSRLLAIAHSQDVVPVLPYSPLWSAVRACAPPEVLSNIQERRLLVMMANMSAAAELDRIERALQDEGVAVIPLKGVSLLRRLYPGLDARRCGDIDLLVKPGDRERACEILCAMGYSPLGEPRPGLLSHPFHGVPLVRTSAHGGHVVELHWNLTDPRFVPVDLDGLWARAQQTREPRGEMSLPSEELLVFLALHLPKHDTGLLRLLVDIDRLVRQERPDWQLVERIARRWRAQTLLFFVLSHARELLGTPVPEGVTRSLSPGTFRRAVVRGLAGPLWVLRPPAVDNLRASQFRLAYCLMLQPAGRVLRAYRTYLCAGGGGAGGALLGLARGLAWPLVIGYSCLRRGPGHEGASP